MHLMFEGELEEKKWRNCSEVFLLCSLTVRQIQDREREEKKCHLWLGSRSQIANNGNGISLGTFKQNQLKLTPDMLEDTIPKPF
jgi:hypothetical protein